jgi:hypothetical protein
MSADIERWPPPNDPIAFESLCLDLWKDIWQDNNAQKNGRSGQPQAGVDVFGQQQGKWVGIQCKQKDGLLRTKVTPTELEEEVRSAKDFKPPLTGFMLATTGPRDAKVQQRARELTIQHEREGLFTVGVWSWEDIWSELYRREQLLKQIAPSYWPRLAALLFGRTLAYAPSRLFSGRNNGSALLIGREREFGELDAAWSGAGKKNIITIVAWGGIGKTSLIAHWAAKKLSQSDHSDIERFFDWSFYSQGRRREGDATGVTKATSADFFLNEALEFFGDPGLAASNTGTWKKGERLAQMIGQYRTLLILDGLESLQDAKSGELRDDGLRTLLRGLAAHSHGLCVVATRQHLPDLAVWHQTTAPEWKLASLTDEAGAALLTKLGVEGADTEKRSLSSVVHGHALTLTLLGNYLRKAHHGDIHCVDCVDLQKADDHVEGGHAFRVIAAYERWFEESNCRTELAILRMLGLFDRPATPDCLAALRWSPISSLTKVLALDDAEDWNVAVAHLVELDLVEERLWEPRRVVGFKQRTAWMQLLLEGRINAHRLVLLC